MTKVGMQLAAALVALAGCGGSDSSADSEAPADSEPSVAEMVDRLDGGAIDSFCEERDQLGDEAAFATFELNYDSFAWVAEAVDLMENPPGAREVYDEIASRC